MVKILPVASFTRSVKLTDLELLFELNLLCFLQKFWLHVNIRKAMLPGLWSAMKKGFNGNAGAVSTKLYSLLVSLPPDVAGSSREFYSLFFSNLREG